MSMTSEEAYAKDCPQSGWGTPCKGKDCPHWVVERLTNGAISCPRNTGTNGLYFDVGIQKDAVMFDNCLKMHDVTMCIDCKNAYGHCAG